MASPADSPHPTLKHLEPLVGTWETIATHPMLVDAVIQGRSTFEWLEGRQFLIWRSHHDHPDIPDSISIIGFDNAGDPDAVGGNQEPGAIHYFDSRGVFRRMQFEATTGVWRFWRDNPGFSQRATCRFSDDGNSFAVTGELSRDDMTWEPDVDVTCRRVPQVATSPD